VNLIADTASRVVRTWWKAETVKLSSSINGVIVPSHSSKAAATTPFRYMQTRQVLQLVSSHQLMLSTCLCY